MLKAWQLDTSPMVRHQDIVTVAFTSGVRSKLCGRELRVSESCKLHCASCTGLTATD